ncbi:MAG: alkaline phosphatase family protein [Oliverpabstia sp.]
MVQTNHNVSTPSILLISVDALKPEFVFEQERLGVKLPNITKYFIKNGLTAPEGMKSVFPTFTYPCHQSMITGTNPATHKTFNNGIFDPIGEHLGAWHWFANTEVKTLWEAAKENGYWSASVAFPTSVGAKGDFIAPEFWWDGSALDSLFIDAVAKPQGIILEMEQEIGQYAGGLDLSDHGDAQRGKAALWMLRNKIAPVISEKPFFMSAYFASFDESAHQNGVYSKEAANSLEKIDVMLGKLIEEARRITDDHLIVCVVSDHGTLDNTHNISPNILLREAGLIEADENGKVISWKAFSQRAGGTAEIRLADPTDAEAAAVLKNVMEQLQSDPESGILEVVTGEEARKRGGFPEAAYVLVSEKGYEIRDDVIGEYCRTRLTQKAQHGYSENFPEMRASFMLTGEGIPKGHIENVRLIDVAPTLAGLMNFTLPDAEGRDLLKQE